MRKVRVHLDDPLIAGVHCALKAISVRAAQAPGSGPTHYIVTGVSGVRCEEAFGAVGSPVRRIIVHHHHVGVWKRLRDLDRDERHILGLVVGRKNDYGFRW